MFDWCYRFDSATASHWRKAPLTGHPWKGLPVQTREGRLALAMVRKLLAKVGDDDLELMYESLLTADPSGMEGDFYDWAGVEAPRKTVLPTSDGPLLKLRHSIELALSPDGKRVVAAHRGAITEVRTGKTLATCALLPNTVYVAWSPDGRHIAATSTSGKIVILDARTGKRLRILVCSGEGCAAPEFSGRQLFAADLGRPDLRLEHKGRS